MCIIASLLSIFFLYTYVTMHVYDSAQIFSDTHALVKSLDDECTAIVPVIRIEKKDCVEYNGSCKVKWSSMKHTMHFYCSMVRMRVLSILF